MAAVFRFLLVSVFFILILEANGQNKSSTTAPQSTNTPPQQTTPIPETSNVPLNTDLANCTCDLIANACDVNCCCDEDCTQSDRDAFICVDDYTPADRRLCFQSNIILINNSPYTVEATDDGLFCIHKDNYEERNYYEVPPVIDDSETFDEYLAKYGGPSFKPQDKDIEISTEHYKSGDPIYTIYESEVLGYLGQPAALTSGACKDANPAGFLLNKVSECIREIGDLSVDCENAAYLSANTYHQYFRVIASPTVFAPYNDTDDNSTFTTQEPSMSTSSPTTGLPGNDTDDSLYARSLRIDVSGPHVCVDVEGINRTCELADPVFDPSSGVCSNALVKVTYRITYNGTEGIQAVAALFTFADINDSSLFLPLQQAYATQFSKADEEESAVFRRSGNPGYRAGEPLMAGKLVQEQDELTYAIEVDSDRDNWLTMASTTARGECAQTGDPRVSVTFGENMRSGCYMKFNRSRLERDCDMIQDMVLEAIRPSGGPTHIATFGTSEPEKVGDWVRIIDELDSQPRSGDGYCSDLVTGGHLEVLYAHVGAVGNPQAKVLGARYHYRTQTVKFQCVGAFCQPGSEGLEQSMEVTASVGFVDVSERAVPASAEKPKITARLPEDFFYPFS